MRRTPVARRLKSFAASFANARLDERMGQAEGENVAFERLRGEVAHLTEIAAALRAELEQKTSELRILRIQNTDLARQVTRLEREHKTLLSSTSWPLRKLKNTTGQRKHVRRALM